MPSRWRDLQAARRAPRVVIRFLGDWKLARDRRLSVRRFRVVVEQSMNVRRGRALASVIDQYEICTGERERPV